MGGMYTDAAFLLSAVIHLIRCLLFIALCLTDLGDI